jgi:hypothetical protein
MITVEQRKESRMSSVRSVPNGDLGVGRQNRGDSVDGLEAGGQGAEGSEPGHGDGS